MISQNSELLPNGSAHLPRFHSNWKSIVAEYQQPNTRRACWQIINTIGPYLSLWVLMFFTLSVSWWLTIPLAVLAGGFLVRSFIIFHDCCHSSFFKSGRVNDFWGVVTGLLSFTPYRYWKWEHNVHHATNGHLERRGIGDIWTMTVEEYLESSPWKRFSYRILRNPFVLFVLAPLFLFLIHYRFPRPQAKGRARESVWITNLALLGMALGLSWVFGFLPWLFIQLIVLTVSGTIGVWLFYVQHQFEDTYWEDGDEWNHVDAALKGSSYYKLPRVLQWFTGNIGFHHIHHLSSRIPNYNLERCHHSDLMFEEVEPLTMWASLRTLNYRLWNEKTRKLISFGQLRKNIRLKELGGPVEPAKRAA